VEKMENETRGLLSPEQLAGHLGCGRTYAYALLAGPNPAIRSFKIGRLRRIRRADVEAFVAERLRDTA
jgi:excisionase family DNA binding protein